MNTILNLILDDSQREMHRSIISEMFEKVPSEMHRKIARANIQQAWMLNTVRKFAELEDIILSVGCYEDTAYEMLKLDGYAVVGIDPVVNNFTVEQYAEQTHDKYDIVFSTSVIEHVDNDEYFIRSMASLVKDGGIGVFTCDFNDRYPNVRKPAEDCRLYTKNDLQIRIPNILKEISCEIVGDVDYDGKIDFEYGGCNYAFATCVFRKINGQK